MIENEKNSEYTEIFLAEALDNYTEINNLLTVLEKNTTDARTIQSLFRITHTLKGNAAGLGFDKIADLTHTLEDFFAAVREGKILLQQDHFPSLFKAADVLGQLIAAIKDLKEVRYLGIKTKLEVMIKNIRVVSAREKTDDVADINPEMDGDSLGRELAEESDIESINVNFSDLVQVPLKKLDNLLNLVGELVIERDRIISTVAASSNEYSHLNRVSSDLQYAVMDIRLVQVGFLFNKFFRIVRDAAANENKKVKLRLEGTDTEIDRNILQAISDSLIHLIRNCVGHGIENPEVRKRHGKPEEGLITLSASSESETVLIRVKDDGGGIDPEYIRKKSIERGLISSQEAAGMSARDVVSLIFAPGFSTMDQVTAIAGRGVGMDVVKRAVEAIGGTVEVESVIGEGTTFTLSLPSSMAVKSTLLCQLGSQTYAIPLAYTESVISLYKSDIHSTTSGLLAVHLNETIYIVFLADLLQKKSEKIKDGSSSFQRMHSEQKLEIVVVSYNGKKIGLVVDKLLQQKEIVERPLFKPFDSIAFLSGITILGNGSVCLSLNVPGMLNELKMNYNSQTIKV